MRFLFAILIPATLLAQVPQSPVVDGMMRAVAMAGQVGRTQLEERRLALREEQLRMEAENRQIEAEDRDFGRQMQAIIEADRGAAVELSDQRLAEACGRLIIKYPDFSDYTLAIGNLASNIGRGDLEGYLEALYLLAKYQYRDIVTVQEALDARTTELPPAPAMPTVDFTKPVRWPFPREASYRPTYRVLIYPEAYRPPVQPFAWAYQPVPKIEPSHSRTNRLLEDIDHELFKMRMDRETDRSLQMMRDWTMPFYGSRW